MSGGGRCRCRRRTPRHCSSAPARTLRPRRATTRARADGGTYYRRRPPANLSVHRRPHLLASFFYFLYTTHCSNLLPNIYMKQHSTIPLGSLESDIMEIIWKEPRSSVRLVFDILKKKRDIAYTTVMTIMSRLHAKGILHRRTHENGSYIYTPTQSKEKFLDKISEHVIKNLIKNCGEVAVARFIDIVEAGNFKQSTQWRKRLKKIK